MPDPHDRPTAVLLHADSASLYCYGYRGGDPADLMAWLQDHAPTAMLPGAWPVRSLGVPRSPEALRLIDACHAIDAEAIR